MPKSRIFNVANMSDNHVNTIRENKNSRENYRIYSTCMTSDFGAFRLWKESAMDINKVKFPNMINDDGPENVNCRKYRDLRFRLSVLIYTGMYMYDFRF